MEYVDMAQVDTWLNRVRDTFVNASELAGKVAELSRQVDEMQVTLRNLQQHNSSLEENLSWSRSERTRLEGDLNATREQLVASNHDRENIRNDRDYWRTLAENREKEIAQLTRENETAVLENFTAREELTAVKAKLATIQAVFGNPVSEVKVVEENHSQQPRNPVTQQWESPYKEPEQGPEVPAARTGTDGSWAF